MTRPSGIGAFAGAAIAPIAIIAALTDSARALGGEPYLHRRPIEEADGWTRLELPDDVLDACRPGLADLRVVTSDREELPYAVGSLAQAGLRWSVQKVERVPGVETSAVVDRGPHPVAIDDVTLAIDGSDFLKPIVVEASDDGASWKEVAHASVFATAEPSRVTMTRISFAPTDRRYLRLRLDDKNSDAVAVKAVFGHATSIAATGATSLREIRVTAVPGTDVTPHASTYVAELPAAHLGIVGLRVLSAEPAFARDVRVYDRFMYRGELSRRLVGAGRVMQGAAGPVQTVVPVSGPTGRTLEIEVSRAGGRALPIIAFVAFVDPTTIVFHAPPSLELTLSFGSVTARPPSYDLAEALSRGPPPKLALARLGPQGPAEEGGAETAALALAAAIPARFAATIDPGGWRKRRRITLPPSGSLASIAVDDRSEQLASLRIVDEQGRQIPYLVERESRLRLAPVTFAVGRPRAEPAQPGSGVSFITIGGMDPTRAIDAVELDASETFFERDLAVEEAAPRRRDRPPPGEDSRRLLGSARWMRRPEESGPLRIPIAQPDQAEFSVSFRNGAEAPLTIVRVAVGRVERRLDFLFSPGQTLVLLSDNPAAAAPHYDLGLFAERIAELPAEMAKLEPAEIVEPAGRQMQTRWLWAAVLVAALGVTAILVRTLRAPPAG